MENNDDNLIRKLRNSVLNIEDFSPEMKKLAKKFFYGDQSVLQAYELMCFVYDESQRDESEEDLVWIYQKEWSFDRPGVHYGMIDAYSSYNKNGEEFILFELIYSPGVVKLIRFKLDSNDVVSKGIILSFGNRFNLKELIGQYVKFYVRNTIDNKGNVFSTITEFYFVPDEELDFVREAEILINNKICDPQNDF